MNRVLLDILVVLVAAKLAAEIADRVGVPAVVGEIVAGVLIGPSVLGFVEPNSVLATLAELGVILLLLEVGMEMDLGDLGRVGRAALSVATIGVIVPFGLGTAASLALGLETGEAVFVGAALTATSVGITARVFGDLRALATIEARTVLGAAVADDVIGLLILTVVTRVVTEGSVSLVGVVGLAALAVGFLVVSTMVGLRLAPPLFRTVARHSRSTGTLVAVALAFTLGLAELAHAVQLAPIIGAFVAGLALARTVPAERIRRELAPVGHLFVPVFFLQIGIDADVREFARPGALGIAAALLAVGVFGKLVAAAGLFGAPGDRLLVGLGMIPRGEVGLIFATLGLREGVFGDDVYAALLVVVLVTTLATPSALRWRLRQMRSDAADDAGGALLAAIEAARRRDRDSLELLQGLPPGVRQLDAPTQAALMGLLVDGDEEAWRLLAMSGVIARALPELGEVLDARSRDVIADPLAPFRWPRVGALRADAEQDAAVLLAALALDTADRSGGGAHGTIHASSPARAIARATAVRLGSPTEEVERAEALVDDAELLVGTARRPDGLDEEPVLALAAHLRDATQLQRLHRLVRSSGLEVWEVERVDALTKLCADALDPDDATLASSLDVERRRRLAVACLELPRAPTAIELIDGAPRAYMLRHDPATVARHVMRRSSHVGRRDAHVYVDEILHADPPERHEWRVEFVARDRIGLLAREARVLAEFRADVIEASVVTWPGRRALASFRVASATPPDAKALATRTRELLALPMSAPPDDRIELTFDDHGSPWYTRCTARGPDRVGVLAAVATAMAVGGASVHSAVIATSGDRLDDVFELTDRRGSKLDARAKARIERALRDGSIRGARGAWLLTRP